MMRSTLPTTRRGRRAFAAAALLFLPHLPAAPARADWPTPAGNAQRTGNVDGKPGPTSPRVRWAYKAPEHFVGAPVPAGGTLYVPALGQLAANGQLHALDLDGDAAKRERWSKGPSLLRLATVSSPAVVADPEAGDLVVFGDGMHQTDGAALYCLHAATGRPLWQYALDGKLVHMEGSPVVAGGRVYIGAGDGGVICVDLRRATLDGQDLSVGELRKRMDARWDELQAAYQKARQTDPDFAIAPGDDALPKATPKVRWQVKDKGWHVDASLTVAGDNVYAASAFVEQDRAGKRVVACLSAEDGAVRWETPVALNPWGGVTVAPGVSVADAAGPGGGDLGIVGCASIRFDKSTVPGAKGQVVALDLATGKVRWTRDVPGGVLSSAAVAGGLAVVAVTDGTLRALDVADGSERWAYAGGQPFFAGPAVAGGVVYAVDLAGVLHAVNLSDGKKRWAFDATADPAVAAPGMVFGSPVVHGGEVFLATCNIEGAHADAPSVVVCVSDKGPSSATPVAKIEVDAKARTIRVPCKIAPRKLANLKEVYPLEVVATYPAPLGQKAHETVVTFDVKPSDVHKALVETFGLSPGTPSRTEDAAAVGPEVAISIEVPGLGGRPLRVPLEKAMVDRRTGRPVPKLRWLFTGSSLRQRDPNRPDRAYGADLTGTLISIYPVTDETVFQSNLTLQDSSLLKLEMNRNLLPEEGAAAVLVIEAKRP